MDTCQCTAAAAAAAGFHVNALQQKTNPCAPSPEGIFVTCKVYARDVPKCYNCDRDAANYKLTCLWMTVECRVCRLSEHGSAGLQPCSAEPLSFKPPPHVFHRQQTPPPVPGPLTPRPYRANIALHYENKRGPVHAAFFWPCSAAGMDRGLRCL
jgi:hypothetical protein